MSLEDLNVNKTAAGVVIQVRVQPRASRNGLTGVQGGALKVRLTAPPVEGRANDALTRYLADLLGLRPYQVQIRSGQRGRLKQVVIEGLEPETLRERLRQHL